MPAIQQRLTGVLRAGQVMSRDTTGVIRWRSLLLKIWVHGCRALEKLANPEEGAPSKEVLQLRGELFSKLGWSHWAAYEEDKLKTYFPVAYPLF